MSERFYNVLFLCTGNTARSILAESILRKDGRDCITPFDAIPFAATTPVPVTHRFFGRSIADLVMPVQREKTALKRGALDNLYMHNNTRVEVAESMAKGAISAQSTPSVACLYWARMSRSASV